MPKREPTMAELEQALLIDEHHLEDECRDQASMFYNVSKRGTLATSRRDEAKRLLSEAEARLDAEVRRDAEVHDEKLTEPAIRARIKLDRSYQATAKNLEDLSIEVGKLRALEESYEHRKEMLKLLVRLYLANYFDEVEERGFRGSGAELAEAKSNYVKRVTAATKPVNSGRTRR